MKRFVAEFLCTMLVVVMAAGAVVSDTFFARAHLTDSSGAMTVAFAYGLATVVVLATVGRLSGGYGNPAIALGMLVTGRLRAKDAPTVLLAQVLGSIAAGGVVLAMTPKDAFDFTAGGVPGLGNGVSIAQGAAIEMVVTFLVTLAVWGAFLDRRTPRSLGPLVAGLGVTAGAIASAPFTGAGLNPARWLGPALASGHFENWPVWVAGPIIGGLLGALVYENVVLAPDATGADEPAPEAAAGDEDAAGARALPAGAPPAEVIVPGGQPAGARRDAAD